MDTKTLKAQTYKIYKSVGSLWCDAIKDNVVFNRYGWVHLSFGRRGHRRSTADLRLRLHLFSFVSQVVKNAKVVIKDTEGTISSRRGKSRKAKYYEIAQLCDGGKKHITVIIRKIESGKTHYFSVRRTSSKTKKALAKAGLL